MGFIGSLLGASGPGFKAVSDPGSTGFYSNQSAQGIQQQQDFLKAIQAQNGLGNQSSVFQQQQGLANQLQGVANGTGPNPALAQLNQQTGQNVANQAALMAGQRGSSANAGLIARQAAQQGAQTQQQAVGQGATLQAQQQLAAMQQLQNQQASMGNLASTQVGQQQGAISGLNQASLQGQSNELGLQANANTTNAGMQGSNAGMQGNLLSGITGGLGAALLAGGGEVPQRYAGGTINVDSDPLMSPVGQQQATASGPQSNAGKFFNGMSSSMNQGQAKSTGNSGMQSAGNNIGSLIGKGINAMSSPSNSLYSSDAAGSPEAYAQANGELEGYASGLSGYGTTSLPGEAAIAGGAGDAGGIGAGLGSAGASGLGSAGSGAALAGLGADAASIGAGIGTAAAEAAPVIEGIGEAAAEVAPLIAAAAHGGKVPALVSPGERYLSPAAVKKVEKGANPMKEGEKIPGKAKVKGAKNSYANDTVPKTLEEGGIVLPRSVTQSKHPHWAAHQFVSQIMAKNGKLPNKSK